ncbi:peptidyl-dipeptidase Dcp [Enterobacter hormaechei]|uniref:peptidyl-dipeptidase Dcp n=1 Tax=Enterobacter hormaechei TaxID=158836 RepID=UPI000795EB8F|nr:peptidyl-dipeptidase Dcp [Enterobacter hormaechei]CZZ26776.1 peptidyl-dipeptidase Dcp . Metallo peptidase. MEROPS family M03A [Enterobacter hormaechei]SAB41496.1 peptidyl-dipeptidase Dcp . Metallo peptidase. MEROPS family M03A [Enterobacter hormaechei]SAB69139.1 peptidyl-dipeptidase Dcp . Metallo peptidase. MEROPS family M03A [Enterobacter hormaechei]SZA34430.1 peptidyl-dipeptidase Dcp . Metallo peptidase. MEROPS family M03A [Enterobacter hormaechei]VAF58367.1 peptidyl-dipeptidase dcp [Ente
MSVNNPFFEISLLPYQAPRFDAINDSHYRPAFDEAMRLKRADIDAIIAQRAAPDFDNTVLALEKSGAMLSRVSSVFFAMTSAHTNDYLQALDEQFSTELAGLANDIWLNDTLFARVEAVWQDREALDAESRRLTEETYQHFVLAGARLNADEKAELKSLNTEAATLTSQFNQRLLAANKAGGLVVDDVRQLDGLSVEEMAAAAHAAAEKGLKERWLIPLLNTTQQPALAALALRETRKKLFSAGWERTQKGDENDTRELIRRLTALRARQAQLLGFDNYASWSIADQMAKTPEAALEFMRGIVPAARGRAALEQADIQKVIDDEQGGFTVQAWDWAFYAERVRSAKYALDESQIKPYFALNTVLEDGVFWTATQLFGIRFVERFDIPVYHPDVRVWEIFDHTGEGMALFYGDFFARDSKAGGAWMGNFVEQSYEFAARPVIYNVCNYQKPANGQTALISWDDVITLFHEFGHTLHGLFASQRYATLSGTNTPRDFVEFPSQINEHWASHPQVFAHFARHYQTGEPMPDALREKMLNATQFNKGYDMTELLSAALLDMNWHGIQEPIEDVEAFEAAALKKEGLDLPAVPPRYRSSYFAHIFGGGYAAGYYAYLWTQMLADDGYQWFVEQGGLTRENGQTFREAILSRGNSTDLAELYRNWRGHDPKIEPMLENRGLSA